MARHWLPGPNWQYTGSDFLVFKGEEYPVILVISQDSVRIKEDEDSLCTALDIIKSIKTTIKTMTTSQESIIKVRFRPNKSILALK